MSSRPDILLLILDTQRADRLSCYGCPVETSPYLDALAEEATFFRHACSAAQWTVPSHTSMFTGLYPGSHHTVHASSVVPAELTTLAERLRDNGYFTAAFCNNPLLGVVNNGLRRGFLEFLNYSGLLTSRPNRAGVHTTIWHRYRQRFKRALAEAITALQDVFARSDTLLDFSFSPLMVPLWQTALSFKGNTAKSLNDAARLFIERKGVEKGQPVFGFINLMGTHMPYRPPLRFMERFAPHVLHDKVAQRYIRRFNSDVFGWLAPLTTVLDGKDKAALDGMYNAEVANQDELIGAFLKKLRTSGRLEETLLIVSADHGEHIGEKQLMGHSAASAYHELVHVPLMVRDPAGNFARSTTVESHVSNRRIFHTILTAAELASPEEQSLTLAEHSGNDPERGLVFAEAIPPANMLHLVERRAPHLIRERDFDLPRRAVWSGPYKLIETGEGQEGLLELYNVLDDPHEDRNLSATLPNETGFLREQLRAFKVQQGELPAAGEDEQTGAGHAASISGAEDDPEVYHRLRNLGYIE